MSDDLVRLTKKNAPASPARLITVLALIAAVCGFLIALTVDLTQDIISSNQSKALRSSLLRIIPGTEHIITFAAGNDGKLRKEENDGDLFYAAYNGNGELLGVAFEGSGPGYGGTIRILFAYNVYKKKVMGMEVTESKETPGLGAKIATDPQFLASFKDMPYEAEHDIEVVKGGKTEPWQIDAIAGATISSNAVAGILTVNGKRALPVINANLDVLEAGER